MTLPDSAKEVIRGGAQPGKRPNVSANVINTRPGRYTVQVQNYDPSRSITYRLELAAHDLVGLWGCLVAVVPNVLKVKVPPKTPL